MEMVSRAMKAASSFQVRSLSFDGVTYERLDHDLTPLQTAISNELGGAWQIVLRNVNEAQEASGQNKLAKGKSAAVSSFWGGHQRFFNHIITSMQMPSIFKSAGRPVRRPRPRHAAGRHQRSQTGAPGGQVPADDDATVIDIDFSRSESLLGYIRSGFPVVQYEEYTDDNGDKHMRPVTGAAGKPVPNVDMVAKRDALLATLESIRVPDNPIDFVNAFGSSNVAEIDGRSRRFVQ
jgi:hypothetical protein